MVGQHLGLEHVRVDAHVAALAAGQVAGEGFGGAHDHVGLHGPLLADETAALDRGHGRLLVDGDAELLARASQTAREACRVDPRAVRRVRGRDRAVEAHALLQLLERDLPDVGLGEAAFATTRYTSLDTRGLGGGGGDT